MSLLNKYYNSTDYCLCINCSNKKLILNFFQSANIDFINMSQYNIVEKKYSIIIGLQKDIKLLHSILWANNHIKKLFVIDALDIKLIQEPKSKFQNTKLWNYVAINSNNDKELGGWENSYTRENFSQNEIEEFISNTHIKLIPYLDKNKRVLEIGCASGYTMYDIYPFVKSYIGTDFSQVAINKNLNRIKEENISNIDLICIAADNIGQLDIPPVDIVIVNSVLHLLDGYCQFYRILDAIMKKIKPNGIIFLGDIMDLDKKSALESSLLDYKLKNPIKNTKLYFDNELFFKRDFFEDLCFEYPFKKVVISDKIATIPNELSLFRYDVIIELGTSNCISKKQNKFQYAFNFYTEK